jgi:transcriptional regulator with XRE-family HTH domain
MRAKHASSKRCQEAREVDRGSASDDFSCARYIDNMNIRSQAVDVPLGRLTEVGLRLGGLMATPVFKRRSSSRSHASSSGHETAPDAEAIGARVAQLRKERGITQVQLSSLLGVSQPVISAYERGAVPLRAEQVAQLALHLRVSSDVLLGLKGAAAPATLAPSTADARLARRLREARALPRRDKEALLRTLDAFLARAAHG